MAGAVIIHGYPGSGRTTHCKRVASENFDGKSVRHVSVGDQIRAIRQQGIHSNHSNYVRSSETPAHLPDEIVNGIVFEALGTPAPDDILLIDGYPCYAPTVDIFHTSLKENNHRLLGTIALDVSLDTSIARTLSRGRRMDDAISNEVWESEIVFRYNRYDQTTRIAILGLSTFAAVETIDANGTEEAVYADFSAALGRLVRQS